MISLASPSVEGARADRATQADLAFSALGNWRPKYPFMSTARRLRRKGAGAGGLVLREHLPRRRQQYLQRGEALAP